MPERPATGGLGPLKAAVFVAYVAVSSLAGDRFPFSRFAMYAGDRSRSSDIVSVASGREVDYRDYTGFHGSYRPAASSDLFPGIERDFRSHVDARSEPGSGEAPFEARICTFEVDRDGARSVCDVLWTGTARPL